jgi:hypothetical protein
MGEMRMEENRPLPQKIKTFAQKPFRRECQCFRQDCWHGRFTATANGSQCREALAQAQPHNHGAGEAHGAQGAARMAARGAARMAARAPCRFDVVLAAWLRHRMKRHARGGRHSSQRFWRFA